MVPLARCDGKFEEGPDEVLVIPLEVEDMAADLQSAAGKMSCGLWLVGLGESLMGKDCCRSTKRSNERYIVLSYSGLFSIGHVYSQRVQQSTYCW